MQQVLIQFFHFMRIEKIKIIIVLSALLSFRASCVTKTLDCANTRYSFELPIIAYPDKDSILIGDTIWFEVKGSTSLQDISSGEIIDYSDAANLGIAISFSALSPENEFTINSVYSFDYILNKGTQLTKGDRNGLSNQYRFAEENKSYVLKLGIIPKSIGTYRVIFSDASNVARNNDKCTKAGFSLIFRDTNQHIYLFPAYDPNGPQSGGGVYYFKVK